MNGKDIFIGLSYIDRRLIEEAESDMLPANARKVFRRPLLAAALIALTLLLVGCGVVYVLKMQNLKIGEQDVTYDVFDYDPDSGEAVAYVGKETVTQQVLTLTGLKGSPSYQATQEWFEFKKSYDPNYIIYESLEGNFPDYPSDYDAYDPYTQEMVDKIDEIANKYDLKLLGKAAGLHGGRLFYEEAGICALLVSGSRAEVDVRSPSLYAEGSLHISLMFMTMPEEEGQWQKRLTTSLYFTKKDCFNPFTMEIGDPSNWREWSYTTASGYDVLMLRSDGVGWIICDRPDATISLRVLTGDDVYTGDKWSSEYMTDWQFQQIAEAIDFSMEPDFSGLVASFEGVDPQNPVQTQNGCTIELKDAVTDGLVAYVTLGITVPEEYSLDGSIISNNYFSEFMVPVSGEKTWGSHNMHRLDDGDGRDNTLELVVECILSKESEDGGEEPAFEPGSVWLFHWEDLMATYWDNQKVQEETLWRIEGDWQFEIIFDDSDFRAVEMVKEPVHTNVVVAWGFDGSDVYGDAAITSFTLRSLSAAITCDPGSAELTDYKNDRHVVVVLKDGTEVRLDQRTQSMNSLVFLTETPVALESVDHIRLADGTKLEG